MSLILAGDAVQHARAAGVAATTKIASWNIKGIPPIGDARVPAIVRGISMMDADLIALLEVRPRDQINSILGGLRCCGKDYAHHLLPCNSKFAMALLYKRHVNVSSVHWIPGSDACEGKSARKAMAAKVKIGQFDFIFVVIHPKAAPTARSRAIRTRQAAAVATYVQTATEGVEKDVLVVGDYNMVPPNAIHAHDAVNFAALNPVNYLRIISNEELAGQGSFVLLGQPQLLLDGYAIARHHTREYVECSLSIVPLHQLMGLRPRRYARQVSDHLPLMATFDIGMDDD